MAVDRCVCHGLTLAVLKRIAQERALDFEGLRAVSGCSTGCGLCEPYVRLMLKTGQTEFAVLRMAEAARIVREKV